MCWLLEFLIILTENSGLHSISLNLVSTGWPRDRGGLLLLLWSGWETRHLYDLSCGRIQLDTVRPTCSILQHVRQLCSETEPEKVCPRVESCKLGGNRPGEVLFSFYFCSALFILHLFNRLDLCFIWKSPHMHVYM